MVFATFAGQGPTFNHTESLSVRGHRPIVRLLRHYNQPEEEA